MRKISLVAAVAVLAATSACKKTGEGEYQVEKPVVGTETDTVNTPSVETGTVKDTRQRARRGREDREEGSERAQGGGEDAGGAGTGQVRRAQAPGPIRPGGPLLVRPGRGIFRRHATHRGPAR